MTRARTLAALLTIWTILLVGSQFSGIGSTTLHTIGIVMDVLVVVFVVLVTIWSWR